MAAWIEKKGGLNVGRDLDLAQRLQMAAVPRDQGGCLAKGVVRLVQTADALRHAQSGHIDSLGRGSRRGRLRSGAR